MNIKKLSKSQTYSALALFFFTLKLIFNYYRMDISHISGYDEYKKNEVFISTLLSNFSGFYDESFNYYLIRVFLFFLTLYFNMKKLKELGFKNYALFLSFFIVTNQIYLVSINLILLIVTLSKKLEEKIIQPDKKIKYKKLLVIDTPDKFEISLILAFILTAISFLIKLNPGEEVSQNTTIFIFYILFVFSAGFFTFEKDRETIFGQAVSMCHIIILLTVIFLVTFTDILNPMYIIVWIMFGYPASLIISLFFLTLGNLVKAKYQGD